MILYTIRNVCKYAIEDRESFVQKVRQETEARNAFAEQDGKKKYDADIRRVQELDVLYRKLYESFATGIIPEDKFKMLSASYESEQKKLQSEIKAYETEISVKKGTEDDIESFYSLVERYTEFEELTPKMLNEFIDKVLVHKAEKVDGKRTQIVEVYLNFIGKIDFPEPERLVDPEQEKIDQYWRDKYWKHKDYELARRKKEIEAAGRVVDARLKAKRERTIQEFNEEVEESGLENMPVIPDRVAYEVRKSSVYAQANKQ